MSGDKTRPPSRFSHWYRPPPGQWSEIPWRLWLPAMTLLVALQLITGAWISAAIIFVLVVLVAGLRIRARR